MKTYRNLFFKSALFLSMFFCLGAQTAFAQIELDEVWLTNDPCDEFSFAYDPCECDSDYCDSDGDGLLDWEDDCPYEGPDDDGWGCPDSDDDGLADWEDDCPYEGPDDDGWGCPDVDSDGDGLLDWEDNCPYEGPDDDGYGCPDLDQDPDQDPDPECPGANRDPETCDCLEGFAEGGLFDTEDCLEKCNTPYTLDATTNTWVLIAGGGAGVIYNGLCIKDPNLDQVIINSCSGENKIYNESIEGCECIVGYEKINESDNDCVPVCPSGVRDVNGDCCPDGFELDSTGNCIDPNASVNDCPSGQIPDPSNPENCMCEDSRKELIDGNCVIICPNKDLINYTIEDRLDRTRFAQKGGLLSMVSDGSDRSASIQTNLSEFKYQNGYPYFTYPNKAYTHSGFSGIIFTNKSTDFYIALGDQCQGLQGDEVRIVDKDRTSLSFSVDLGNLNRILGSESGGSTLLKLNTSYAVESYYVDIPNTPNIGVFRTMTGSLKLESKFLNYSREIQTSILFVPVVIPLNLEASVAGSGSISYIRDDSSSAGNSLNGSLSIGLSGKIEAGVGVGIANLCSISILGGGHFDSNITGVLGVNDKTIFVEPGTVSVTATPVITLQIAAGSITCKLYERTFDDYSWGCGVAGDCTAYDKINLYTFDK